MHQHIDLVFLSILDEVDDSVEKALDVLVLRVLQEKGEVDDSFTLKPVLTIVPSTIYDSLDSVLL